MPVNLIFFEFFLRYLKKSPLPQPTSKIDGDDNEVNIISSIFHEMNATLNRKGSITSKDVKTIINFTANNNDTNAQPVDLTVHYGRKGAISARTPGQEDYINIVRKNDMVFSVGPAGTGKTFIAVAFAVSALSCCCV